MVMVLAETLVCLFILIIGFISLYISYRREGAIIWPFLSVMIFLVNMLYAYSIPFAVNGSGEVVPTSANVVLAGICMMFAFIALLKTLFIGFSFFKR